MKFLFAEFRSPEDGPDVCRWQWVLPAPHLENVFVDLAEGETCIAAEVREGFDPDEGLIALKATYPGLPEALLCTYILKTAVALNSASPGWPVPPAVDTRVRVFCDHSRATLQDTATQKTLVLWEHLDTEKYL